MNGLPYYKAYPRDFFDGTVGLDFEVKAAYRLLLDLIYQHGGRLVDDPRFIAGQLGCSVRKWNSLREAIIATGKVVVISGYLGNYRADKELDSLKLLQDKQRENRSRPNKNKGLTNTTVSPKADHTDTDTDNTTTSVVVAAAAPPQDPTDRERLLAAMGVGPDGLTGPSGFIGTQVDMAEAAKWSALGLSLSEQCAVIAENCTRQRAANRSWMPRRFGYFTGAMADLAAKKLQPVPSGTSQPQSRDDQINRWKRIAGQ